MTTTIMMDIESPATKRIALVAHDNMKDEMLEWAKDHETELSRHTLVGTGTTGRLITEHTGLTVERLRSGPLGGDQQLGARIAEGLIDILMFFGTHSNHSHTTQTSKRFYVLLLCGTYPWPATEQVQTSLSLPHSFRRCTSDECRNTSNAYSDGGAGGPNRFRFGSLCFTEKTKLAIGTIIHHPRWSVSCIRLTETAIDGSSSPTENKVEMASPKPDDIACNKNANSVQYQYSLRVARPEKVA